MIKANRKIQTICHKCGKRIYKGFANYIPNHVEKPKYYHPICLQKN